MAIFTNQATLIYNGQSTNSNVTTGELVDALTITKTALDATYGANGRITYTVNAVNTGAAITGATLTDNLGEYTPATTPVVPLDYVDGSLRLFVNGIEVPSPAVTAGPPLTVTGIDIPAGGTLLVIYEATANGFAPLAPGSVITNTAEMQAGGLTVADSATVTVGDSVSLTIAKAICPPTVTDNGTLTYTFIIQNTGNSEVVATDDVIVTDTFNPILNPIAVTYNGTAWTEGTEYTYNETTGEFATVAGNITVPAATYTQDPVTGQVTQSPGVAVITVTGTV